MSYNYQTNNADFYSAYTPQLNQIHLKNNVNNIEDYPFNGCMYETFGEEFDYVKNYPRQHVWTLIDEGDELVISSGLHYVNRIGYIITESPATSKFETFNI